MEDSLWRGITLIFFALAVAGVTRAVGTTWGKYSPSLCTVIIRSVFGGIIYLLCLIAIIYSCIWIGRGY